MAKSVKRPVDPQSRTERLSRIKRRVSRETDYITQMRADGDA